MWWTVANFPANPVCDDAGVDDVYIRRCDRAAPAIRLDGRAEPEYHAVGRDPDSDQRPFQHIFMLLGFFKAIPRELDEAAMVDGSGFVRTFFRIILPLLTPGLGVAGLFAFRHAWNEYILPLVFTMTNPQLQTLTVGLANLRYGSSAAMQIHLMMAGACLSILPMLLAYIVANKSFIQVTAGSVKG